jgi:hypothetical protein
MLTVYLTRPAQSQKMFGVFPAIRIADARLAGKKGMKPLTLQVLQQGNGRYIAVSAT